MTNVTAPPSIAARREIWITLLLVLLALVLRLAYLAIARSEPGFSFGDPDRYMANGARLATADGFRWTFEAVYYPWGGRRYTLPPLYPFVLGLVASFPGYPLTAAIGQIAINSLSVIPLVALGRRLHSVGAGLIAGFLYAIWGGGIAGTRFFMQEALYVPLVIVTFLALVRAYDGARGPGRFFVAGLALGLATLCRSMPIYYLAVVVLAHTAVFRFERAALREAGALLIGFALLTVPYSVALSLHLNRPTFVEDHGGILVAHRFGAPGTHPPGLATIALALASEGARNPIGFTADALDRARAVFHVSGGRVIEQTVNAPTEAAAMVWKVLAHATIDLPLVLTTLLAVPGFVLLRNRTAAWLVGGWILLNVALVAVTGFGGARLRSPFEPHLMVLAGAVLSGGWRPVSRGRIAAALAGAGIGALAVIPQLPRTLQARGDYGVEWAPTSPRSVATIRGRGGFNALTDRDGGLALNFTNPGPDAESVHVTVEGVTVADLTVLPGSTRELRTVTMGHSLAFVEVSGASRSGIVIEVPRR